MEAKSFLFVKVKMEKFSHFYLSCFSSDRWEIEMSSLLNCVFSEQHKNVTVTAPGSGYPGLDPAGPDFTDGQP